MEYMRKNSRELLIEKYIKPSKIEIGYNGIVAERWCNKQGERHSFNGQPASIWYYNDKITSKYWYKNDKCIKTKHY